MLLSVTTYLVASNQAINFLEQREAVSLTLQVAVAVGALLTLLVAADALSGERERGTLEALLLAPSPRWELVLGKGIAALSLWFAAFVVAVPYVWFLGRGIGLVAAPLASGLLVGTLLSLAFAGIGLTVSGAAATNRLSLAVHVFILLALYAPTQFPTGAQTGWAGELVQRFNPLTAGLHYLGRLVIDAHGGTDRRLATHAGDRGGDLYRGRAGHRAVHHLGGSEPMNRGRGWYSGCDVRHRRVAGEGRQLTGGLGHPRQIVRPSQPRPVLRLQARSDNLGSAQPRLVVHLNVLSLDDSVYVDPEDWSSNRTRYVAAPPGGAIDVRWILKAVNGGSFVVYVAVLSRDGSGPIAVSQPLHVRVAERRTLNPAEYSRSSSPSRAPWPPSRSVAGSCASAGEPLPPTPEGDMAHDVLRRTLSRSP